MRLYFYDEAGFAPSQPTGRSWFLPGASREVPQESPQGRRVTALAALEPLADPPRLRTRVVGRRVTCEQVFDALAALPHSRMQPAVVVLDNAPVHHARACAEARRRLRREGLRLAFLPPYSPDLNQVEPQFRAVKYDEMPERTYFGADALFDAVVLAFARRARKVSRVETLFIDGD